MLKLLFCCDTALQIHIYFSANIIHSVSFNIAVFQIFTPTESVCLINVFPDVWTWGKKALWVSFC